MSTKSVSFAYTVRRNPSGVTEGSARVFGDSWKLRASCPDASASGQDYCRAHPHRSLWADKTCSRVLLSSAFARCRAEVDPTPWLEKCRQDSCACDAGGDCECLCTAIASYAARCAAAGAPVRWRTPELCRKHTVA